jgi:hypothetical protein
MGRESWNESVLAAPLVWDRLALSLMLSSFFVIVVSDFASARLGRALLAPAVILGSYSVLHWRWTELLGRGDLRLYAFVQFYPVIAVPFIAALFRSRYDSRGALLSTCALYGAAKLCELYDYPIRDLLGFWSGHTLKHFVAAAASYLPLHALRRRVERSRVGRSQRSDEPTRLNSVQTQSLHAPL